MSTAKLRIGVVRRKCTGRVVFARESCRRTGPRGARLERVAPQHDGRRARRDETSRRRQAVPTHFPSAATALRWLTRRSVPS